MNPGNLTGEKRGSLKRPATGVGNLGLMQGTTC